jgi:nucleoside-diphosphate-sugar epimerase
MKKTLITGGAGFIGFHLLKRLLKDGYHVDLIDNLSRGSLDNEMKNILNNTDVNLYNLDLLQSHELYELDNNYDLIFHFAAIIGVSNVLNRPYDVLSDNILMLLNMISFAKHQTALKRFVFTSTSEVYAGTLQNFDLPIPTPESTPLALTNLSHPRTSYMLSKIYGEALCHHAGIPFTIVRPHNVYGPRMGMAHAIPELLKKAHSSEDKGLLDVFSVSHRRTFCYIDDFVEMIILSAELPSCEGQTLNLGSQSPELSIEALAKLIISATGKNLRINPQPETPGSPARRCPDMTKAFKLTGYKPKVEIETGIHLTYEWYKNNSYLK